MFNSNCSIEYKYKFDKLMVFHLIIATRREYQNNENKNRSTENLFGDIFLYKAGCLWE